MQKRWKANYSYMTQLNSYRIFSPQSPLIIHDLFDLITKMVVHKKDLDTHVRYSVGHGMSILGLDCVPMTQVWLDTNADTPKCMNALYSTPQPADEKMLKMLWQYRHQLAHLPETWKDQIEGHPLLGKIPFHPERLEFASIADHIMEIAANSHKTMYDIDFLILKIWGVHDELPQKTMQDLAYRYPEVLELNGWYSYEDFDVSPPQS